MSDLNIALTDLINIVDDCLMSCEEAQERHRNPKEKCPTLNDTLQYRIKTISKYNIDPLFNMILQKQLEPLENYKTTPLKNLPKELIRKIETIKQAFFKTECPSTTFFEGNSVKCLSYADKYQLMQKIYDYSVNKKQQLNEEALHRLNKECILFLQTHYNFTTCKELDKITPYSEALTPIDSDITPRSTQFYSDYIDTPRMSNQTIHFPSGAIRATTVEDGHSLINMVKKFANSICPTNTPEKLRERVENTILFAISQHTSNIFLGAYKNILTNVLAMENIDFPPETSKVILSLSRIINFKGGIVPYAFKISITGEAKHRYTGFALDDSLLSIEDFHHLRDEFGVGSVATGSVEGSYELYIKENEIEAKNAEGKYWIEIDK